MVNKQIIVSFDKVVLPIDREDALLERILANAAAEHRSARNKQERNCQSQTQYNKKAAHGQNRIHSRYVPLKRKVLLALIAAVILLLSACAAYAIYWSSTQQAKEYSQSDQAVADRFALAEQSANEIIAGSTFYWPVVGTAEIDGLTIELHGVAYENYGAPEIVVRFAATDKKAEDDSRLYNVDYVLTVGGKDYPAYTKSEDTTRERPVIGSTTVFGNAEYQIRFKDLKHEIKSGTRMCLNGSLYAYDETDQRRESLGSFALDFTYETPTEQIEAERERLIEEILNRLNAEAEGTNEVLAEQPDNATELNIVQGAFTIKDVAVSDEGILLGTIGERGWYDSGTNTPYTLYLDGYRIDEQILNTIRHEHTDQPRLTADYGYAATETNLKLAYWYDSVEKLPENILVALLNVGETTSFGWPGDDTVHTRTSQDIEILFRINPRTGKVTMPVNDAERVAWYEETKRLAGDGRNNDLYIPVNGEQTINGINLRLQEIHLQPYSRKLFITGTIDGLYYPAQAEMNVAEIYIDGVMQNTEEMKALAAQYSFSEVRAKEWVASYGGWQVHDDWSKGFGCELTFIHKHFLKRSPYVSYGTPTTVPRVGNVF